MFDFLNPYMLGIKLAGIGIALLALFTLVLSWSSRGQEIASMTAWRSTVVLAATDATVEPDAKGFRKALAPEAVPAAISALKRSYDSCQAAGREKSIIAEAAKTRSDLADKALANATVLFNNEYSSAAKRIDALAQVKAAPTPQLQCQAVGADSKAAWEGWK